MNSRAKAVALGILALAACKQEVPSKTRQPVDLADREPQPPIPAPGTGPDARTPFAPARPTLNPKSTRAAEELVRGLVRLINAGRLNEAYMLLGPAAPPRTDFDHHLAGYTRATQGVAGDQEGAAGSIYVSVPLSFSGPGGRKRGAAVILRRANDVPGSTEGQRHWHVERFDWGTP